jgi:VanZ family protein
VTLLPTPLKKGNFWWAGLFGFMLLTLVLNSVPGLYLLSLGDSNADFYLRQGGHALIHALLTFFAWRAALGSFNQPMVFAVSFAVSFSILNETYQGLIPGRNPNVEDVAYNLAGVLTALVWIHFWFRKNIVSQG